MVRKAENRVLKFPKDVNVWGFSGKRDRCGRQGCPAIQTGAADASASEEVSERFQAIRDFTSL